MRTMRPFLQIQKTHEIRVYHFVWQYWKIELLFVKVSTHKWYIFFKNKSLFLQSQDIPSVKIIYHQKE